MAAVPRSLRRLASAALPLLLVACGSTTPRTVKPETDLHHPSATRRIEAVSAVAKSGATQHVPALIDLLEDPDVGVRMTAAQALQQLTGRDTGYRPYASPEERARQAADWRAWWAARGGAPRTTPGGPVRDGGADAARP